MIMVYVLAITVNVMAKELINMQRIMHQICLLKMK